MDPIERNISDGTPQDVVDRYKHLVELAGKSDFGILDSNVVILDTETTGLSFKHDELIQIAAAKVQGGEISDWYVTFVDPGKPIPEDIERLTDIHDSDVEGAPSPNDALEKLSEFVGDALVVAHNVGFDKTFTTAHPGGYPLLENIWLDSLDMARIALPRLKSHRLIDLVNTFGAPASTHRADDDVSATCVVYRILLAAIASMPLSLVREIASMASIEEWSTGYAFYEIALMRENSIIDTVSQNASFSKVRKDVSCETSRTQDEIEHQQAKSIVDTNGGLISSEQGELFPDTVRRKASRSFSLRAMRQLRVSSLPPRRARRDAEDLVGAIEYPKEREVEEAFTADGVLGSIYPDYEPRDEQRRMALAIADAFETSENLVVEAGTGVGKSMAYLLPSALLAQSNGIGVGVATKTNSLLDQLVYQELPSLSEALQSRYPNSEPLTWAPLKGMTHYPCLRKVGRLVDSGPGMREVAGKQISQAPALAALLSYIEQTDFDDMDALKIDYRALPRYLVTSTSNECLRRKCPYFGKTCYAHGARRRAESVDIIVTNHALLFCDLAADGGLLPTVRHWIVDEAHSAENEARRAFAESVDSDALVKIVNAVGDTSRSRNVFERAERSIESVDGEQLVLFFGLTSKCKSAGAEFARAAEEYLVRVKDLLYFDPVNKTRKGQSYEQVDIWINHEVRQTAVFGDLALCVHALIEASDKLIKASQDVVAYLEGIDEAAVSQREIASCTMELRELRNAAEVIFELAPETYAYQATVYKKKDRRTDSVQALLVDVGDKMNETLYTRTHSVIYTSATLTVGGSFDSFNNAVGLNRSEFSAARSLELESSYDFDNNMIVYVVSDMPEPNDPDYLPALNDLLVKLHRAQNGSMLSLFTNRREMERSYDYVSSELKEDELRVVCQKYGVSVKGLRDDFLADEHLSLFALKSFWEGFDAPGATLKGVVIPKLPFARPTDPLYCERASRDDRAWWHYVLPQAIIETKQAAGRLIRKADDHGVLVLADKRLVSKRYGKTFLRSLQSNTIRVCTADEVVAAVEMLARW